MIRTKEELKFYLAEDLKRIGRKPGLKDRLVKNEVYYIYKYLKNLRYLEYYLNTGKCRLLYYYHFLRYKRMCYDLKVIIKPNTVGAGFRLYHLGGFVHIKDNCQIGSNCSMLPGVVIGNKRLEEDNSRVEIGDNCYIGLDVKIFGEVRIGDNVIIGANSVVTKDIPDNCVAGGIPAKVIGKR